MAGRQAGKKTAARGGVARTKGKRRAGAEGDGKDSPTRHRTRCGICKHPQREEIEREFLDWVSPRELAERWKTGSYRAIYRHVHATGLYQQRRKNRQDALDRIIERVGEVQVTAAAVVSAVRLGAKLDREEKEEQGMGGWQAGFGLSMDGLPRTDAVTGHAKPRGGGAAAADGGD